MKEEERKKMREKKKKEGEGSFLGKRERKSEFLRVLN